MMEEFASAAGILFAVGGMLLLISILILVVIHPRPQWAVRLGLAGLFVATGSGAFLLMAGVIATIGLISPPAALLFSPVMIVGSGLISYALWERIRPGIWIPIWRWFSQMSM